MLEAGVRDDGVEPTEPLQRRVDHRAVSVTCRQVAVWEVDAVHGPAVALELFDDRRTDAAGCTRDERCSQANGPQRTTLAAHV